jgi:signal transduction histidine kinase
MVAVLAVALLALFAALMILEFVAHDSPIQAAEGSSTIDRLKRLYPVLEKVSERELPAFVDVASSCHSGYAVTDLPFRFDRTTEETSRLQTQIAEELSLEADRVRVGHARLTRTDFAYSRCRDSEIDLPIDGIVIGMRLRSGKWFNAEVHPHEWHFREKLDWMMQASAVFFFVGGIAIFFMHRLSKPLNSLTLAAKRFGAGLKPSKLEERGPVDVRRAIHAFNTMQQQVTDEIARRTNTLAAISHDVRTPLTALRVKAELIDNVEVRNDLISSINRMERITASALEFLRGQSRSEPLRSVDLSSLLESECSNFEEIGHDVKFLGGRDIHYTCRPDALARAVRNLVDNAVKYGNCARVVVRASADSVEISVSDEGPGIPSDQFERALEPFVRLSAARESNGSGFGLGLAIAKAIAEGHDGELILAANITRGLLATIRLPTGGSG